MRLRGGIFQVSHEPLAGAHLDNTLRLLVQNGFRVGLRYLFRLAYSLAMGAFARSFYPWEQILYGRRIARTELAGDPLFLIGFWRSGTTYLHHLLSLDSSFGHATTYQCMVPSVFLAAREVVRPILAASLPPTRPMDNVPMSPELPQEEEYALGALTPYAYYNAWMFPRNIRRYHRFVSFKGVERRIVAEWKRAYLKLLRKLTFASGGRRLLLKNPANTARVRLLLEMFPRAQFVFVHRNPYEVYRSKWHFLTRVLPLYCVQEPPGIQELQEAVFDLYEETTRAYLEARSLIPQGALAEVAYADLIRDPLATVASIHDRLGLDGFRNHGARLEEYVREQSAYVPNPHALEERLREQVYRRWRFAFEAFGYPRSSP